MKKINEKIVDSLVLDFPNDNDLIDEKYVIEHYKQWFCNVILSKNNHFEVVGDDKVYSFYIERSRENIHKFNCLCFICKIDLHVSEKI